MAKSNDSRDLFDKDKLFRDIEYFRQLYPVKNRITYYKDMAVERLKTERDPKTRKILDDLLFTAGHSFEALEKGDIDLFSHCFEQVIRDSVELQLPAFERRVRKAMGKKGGQSGARPRGVFLTLLEKITEHIGVDDQQLVREWWSQCRDEDEPLDSEDHLALNYRAWTDGDQYYFEHENLKYIKNKLQIQKGLSSLRNS